MLPHMQWVSNLNLAKLSIVLGIPRVLRLAQCGTRAALGMPGNEAGTLAEVCQVRQSAIEHMAVS